MLSKGAANQAYPQQCDAPVTCWGRELRAKEHCHLERERETVGNSLLLEET